jgi:hypothetical protein
MPAILPILGRGNDQRVRILAALAPGRQSQLAGRLGGNQAACHQLGEEPLQVQAGREGLGFGACMSMGGSGHAELWQRVID